MRPYVIPFLATVFALLFTGLRFDVLPALRLCSVADRPLGELSGYTSEDEVADPMRLRSLPADTCVTRRRYIDAARRRYVVTLVVGGCSRSSIHRPEICLPLQGFALVSERTVDIDGVFWRRLTLAAGERRYEFAYTFFNQAGFRSASQAFCAAKDAFDRAFFRRIDRWMMLTVFAPESDEAELHRFLTDAKPLVCPIPGKAGPRHSRSRQAPASADVQRPD